MIMEWYQTYPHVGSGGATFPEHKRLMVLPLNDHVYHETSWETEVQTLVTAAIQTDGWRDKTKIGLIGHSKDRTSYYLKKFPQWGDEDVVAYTDRHTISATQVRDSYFQDQAFRLDERCPTDKNHCLPGIIPNICPDSTCNFLMRFNGSHEFQYVMDEIDFNMDYQNRHQLEHRFLFQL